MKYDNASEFRRPFQGILGLAPRDEGAGPLVVEEMYNEGTIDAP